MYLGQYKKQQNVSVNLRAKLRKRSFFVAEGSTGKPRRDRIIDFRRVSVRAGAQKKARRRRCNDRNVNKGSRRRWLTSFAIRSEQRFRRKQMPLDDARFQRGIWNESEFRNETS